ncbi:MAG TPA: hypothetical protein VFW50_23640 [Streptosporangiaceae bacterium]|nr:hypothetical protein [Streptosporangiaceae bacterium]
MLADLGSIRRGPATKAEKSATFRPAWDAGHRVGRGLGRRAFLASDEIRSITGVTLPVESGVLGVTPLMMAPHLRCPRPRYRPRSWSR